jgi:transcriptional regulator with XRE-family HTH domain
MNPFASSPSDHSKKPCHERRPLISLSWRRSMTSCPVRKTEQSAPVQTDSGSPERRAIGQRIKEAITRRGISQNQLARHFKKVPSAMNGWVTGRTQPSLEQLAEICRLTHATADWILGIPGSPEPPPPPVPPEDLARAASAMRDAAEVFERMAPYAATSRQRGKKKR